MSGRAMHRGGAGVMPGVVPGVVLGVVLGMIVTLPASDAAARGAQGPISGDRVVIDVRTAWASAVTAYRQGPTGERVGVSVRSEGRGTRRDEYVVRLSPEAGDRKEAMLLELGTLRVYASAGEVLAWLDGAGQTYWRATYEGELDVVKLGRLIPPVSLPQLTALRGGDDVGVVSMFAPEIAWTSAAITGLDEQARVSISGRPGASGIPAGDAPATMVLMATGRFESLSVTIAPGTTLELKMTSIEPGDVGAWKPDLAGRRRVETLSELRARPESAGKGQGG